MNTKKGEGDMENVNIVLAANILKYRKKKGLSQEELANKLGVTFQAVSKWENAKAAPDIAFLPVMAEIFGCYENNWMLGMYVYEAILDCSPVLHAFSKKNTKPLPYAEKPYLFDKLEKKTEEQKENDVEAERLKAIIHFNNWFRATKKQFQNKE